MTIRRQALVAAAAAALLLGGPAAAQEVKVEEHVLPNGMKLLLVHRPDEPSVSAGWVAKVGSVNERVGITGISHLFEHMMFKGTTTIGSKDPKRDLEIIAEQEKLRDEMRAEESKMRAAWRRGEVDDITKPESRTARLQGARREVRRARQGAARPPRQERVRPDLHEERRLGDERLHDERPDGLLHHRAEEQARALVLDGVRPAEGPRLPRVLRRAGRRLRGAPAARRVDPDREARRGVRLDLLALDPLHLARHRLRLRRREHHEGRRPTTTSRPTTRRTT